uniref:Voltage-dependent calcium channel gamma-8 subunit n=1 Tax=Buteo japonicus TaxID=224669 RepID=A0A8B9Z3M4_9AVES
MGSHGLTWDHASSHGLTQAHMGSHGLTWDHTGPYGLTQTDMGSYGITRDHMGREKGRCVASEYFLEPEINLVTENTENILKTVRTATPFPMVSLFLVFTAFVISNVGHIRPQRTLLAFVSGLSNIIGVIVYISANAGDPGTKRDEDKKSHYSYGWSFYFGGLSFILAEAIGVLAVNLYIERH